MQKPFAYPYILIIYIKSNITPPASNVEMMASRLLLSQMMPIMPNTRAAGKENITSSPPRAARGLPQPGLHRDNRITVAPAMINNVADIFP
jgi:hypothetical protein